jgi:hypothetical protein
MVRRKPRPRNSTPARPTISSHGAHDEEPQTTQRPDHHSQTRSGGSTTEDSAAPSARSSSGAARQRSVLIVADRSRTEARLGSVEAFGLLRRARPGGAPRLQTLQCGGPCWGGPIPSVATSVFPTGSALFRRCNQVFLAGQRRSERCTEEAPSGSGFERRRLRLPQARMRGSPARQFAARRAAPNVNVRIVVGSRSPGAGHRGSRVRRSVASVTRSLSVDRPTESGLRAFRSSSCWAEARSV